MPQLLHEPWQRLRRHVQYRNARREVSSPDIDNQIARVKDLIVKREEIDAELSAIFGITLKVRKPQRCSVCGEEGHSARTCRSSRATP